jgi:hypothetical protein
MHGTETKNKLVAKGRLTNSLLFIENEQSNIDTVELSHVHVTHE